MSRAEAATADTAPRTTIEIDEREFQLLYGLYLELLFQRRLAAKFWARIPGPMRLAVVNLIKLYSGGDWARLRAVDHSGGVFVSNGKGAGL